jgi:hypothetical protein
MEAVAYTSPVEYEALENYPSLSEPLLVPSLFQCPA